MPELPEVEIFKRFAETHALGKLITGVQVFNPKILEHTTEAQLQKALKGKTLDQVLRRGKTLFVRIASDGKGKKGEEAWLLFHFGMTGYFTFFTDKEGEELTTAYGDKEKKGKHLRVQFDFADGTHFGFDEQRMFGKLSLIDDPQAYIAARELGPDALTVDAKTFKADLIVRKGQIKPALMDQSLVAGMGNVYVDEALYLCGIHPERRISELEKTDVDCLYKTMIDVLKKTVAAKADRKKLPEHYLLHHRHKNGNCPKHPKQKLEIKTVGGRTTYFCPKCQKRIL